MNTCAILPVDKPAGWTSFDVLAKLRGALGTRRLGHAGTLDPMATGVLAVFIGNATAAADRQPDHDKTYEATIRLGLRTDTGDVTGTALETAPVTVGEAELKAVLPQFMGRQMQLPPMYSAVKINGQPLYKAARKGQTVERTPRPITIYEITYLGSPAPGDYTIRVSCSKGTYIRVLAEDIGTALGVPATLAALRRTRAGAFKIEECHTLPEILVSMQFMADVELVCEACGGKRFRDEILEVKYRGKSIYDVLEMTVDDAIAFFGEDKKDPTCKRIVERLKPLQDVGLGYIKLGQSSSTLSGGESQRVKLASFLTKDSAQGGVMFIFDEPTTGLHFHDINKLLAAFNALIERGHTIVIVEHNMDVIKCADWVVDLGPEAGTGGGRVVFEGTPRNLEQCPASYTGKYLRLRTKL